MATKKAKDNKVSDEQAIQDQSIQEQEQADADSGETVSNELQDAVLKNKRRKRHPGTWVPLTEEELKIHQAAGNLIGWDQERKEGLLRE